MTSSVIVGGARTPIGKFKGALSDLTAMHLGGRAIHAALKSAGVSAEAVGYVVMGQALQAGCGQNPARQAAVAAGIGMQVPSLTLNRVCLSGLDAIAHADLLIRSGEYEVVIAGGMESMTNAPHLLRGSRADRKAGKAETVDAVFYDGLTCAFDQELMGQATERYNARYSLSRTEQDELALASHKRAADAWSSGRMAEEVAALAELAADEGIIPAISLDDLAQQRPAFAAAGTITAGNASQLSDGAAALVLMSEAKARELSLQPWARIAGFAAVAGPDASLHEQPANAILAASQRVGINVADIQLFEINEAFAAVSAVSAQVLGVSHDRVNVNGGAIALGHPLGMSGTRLALHLALELRRRGGGLGAAAACGGGGQGSALLLRAE